MYEIAWENIQQYGISALVSQTSFGGETSGSVVKCRLFSQANVWKWERFSSFLTINGRIESNRPQSTSVSLKKCNRITSSAVRLKGAKFNLCKSKTKSRLQQFYQSDVGGSREVSRGIATCSRSIMCFHLATLFDPCKTMFTLYCVAFTPP